LRSAVIADLWKRFRGALCFRGLNATFEEGPIAVILGPNGSGKTRL
jgi:ABC-type multidrug transport system ATPase subunit